MAGNRSKCIRSVEVWKEAPGVSALVHLIAYWKNIRRPVREWLLSITKSSRGWVSQGLSRGCRDHPNVEVLGRSPGVRLVPVQLTLKIGRRTWRFTHANILDGRGVL